MPNNKDSFALHYYLGTTWGDIALAITVTEDGFTVIDNRHEEDLEEESGNVTEAQEIVIKKVKQMIYTNLERIKDIRNAEDQVRHNQNNEGLFNRIRKKNIPEYIMNNITIIMYGEEYTLDGWTEYEEFNEKELPVRDTFYKILSELYSILNIRDYKREDEIGKVTTEDVKEAVTDVHQDNMRAVAECIKRDLEPKDPTQETPAQ